MRALRHTLFVLLLVLLPGCNTVGPKAVRSGRKSYNQVIQRTDKEELLLNLVRLRYGDTPVYLSISSVATQFDFNYGGGASASLFDQDASAGNTVVSPNFSMRFSERPTITYAPVKGKTFVRQMLTPLQPEFVLLLYYSGWSIDRLFRVCVVHMNGLRNAPGASGPTPSRAPEYREFLAACRCFRELQVMDALEFVQRTEGETASLHLVLDARAARSAPAAELRKLLKLDPEANEYEIVWTGDNNDPDKIGLVTRSMTSILFYLSHGVEVPASDIERGHVVMTRRPDGSAFDWKELLGDFFEIRSAAPAEGGELTQVHYNGQKFYIDKADHETKHTFMLLTQMLALKGGDAETQAPLLTLPVGQ